MYGSVNHAWINISGGVSCDLLAYIEKPFETIFTETDALTEFCKIKVSSELL